VSSTERVSEYLGLGQEAGLDVDEQRELGSQADNITYPLKSVKDQPGKGMAVRRKVYKRFLQGYTPYHIAKELECHYNFVIQSIEAARGELNKWHSNKLSEMTEEAVEVFRMVQQVAWEHLEEGKREADKMLPIIARAEESISKIRGVLSDKVTHVGDITHHMKMYDFVDKYPEMVEGKVLDDDADLKELTSPVGEPFAPDDISEDEMPELTDLDVHERTVEWEDKRRAKWKRGNDTRKNKKLEESKNL
jgi:hypothetical protein